MNIQSLSKTYTPTFPSPRRGVDGPTIEGFQDLFTPSQPSSEMPDLRKLPGFNKSRTMGDLDSPLFEDGKTTRRELIERDLAASEKASNEKWERIGVNPRMVMGGLDSPLFVDGKVTTKRQLILDGKADPVTWGAY